jgi:iron(III) transport system permease protein
MLRFSTPTRFALCAFLYGLFAALVGLPLAALAWKTAGGGTATASVAFAGEQLRHVLFLNGRVLLQSLAAAAFTGITAAWLATALAWAARESKWKANALMVVAVVLALTPGPILGQGLKETIQYLLSGEEKVLAALNVSPTFPPLRSALYDQPSPLPTLLAGLLRFLPVALLIVSPVIRALPRDLLDLAKLDGRSAWRNVGRPATARATALAAVAVAGLTLGEVSASKLVAPPGYKLFILDLFDQMHYGAEPTVAALCLVQIAMTVVMLAAIEELHRVARLR